jgi:hypothetical protein
MARSMLSASPMTSIAQKNRGNADVPDRRSTHCLEADARRLVQRLSENRCRANHARTESTARKPQYGGLGRAAHRIVVG